MAAQARGKGLEVEIAKFEDWDPAGRRFDTVLAAQTWHWIDPRAGALKAAEALGNGGRVALMWNVFDAPPDVKKSFAEINARIIPDVPNPWASPVPMVQGYQAIFGKAIDGLRQSPAFQPAEQWRVDWELTYTRDEWLEVVPTHGGLYARLSPETMTELLTATGAAIGDTLTMHYSTVTVTATKNAPG